MIDPKTRPKAIWELRRSTHRYLTRYAVASWVQQEHAGAGEPHVPPSLEHLHGDKRRKTLARHEAGRISRAALYGCEAAVTTLAIDLGAMLRTRAHANAVMTAGHPSVVATSDIRPPAPCGFLRWGNGVGYTPDGIPVIACHWETIAEGCWIVFWADNCVVAEVMRNRNKNISPFLDEYLKLAGPLAYDFSVLLGPHSPHVDAQTPPDPPIQAGSTVDPQTALVYTLLGTWQALTMTGMTVKTRHEPSRTDALADQRAGVVPTIVTRVSASDAAADTLRDLLQDRPGR